MNAPANGPNNALEPAKPCKAPNTPEKKLGRLQTLRTRPMYAVILLLGVFALSQCTPVLAISAKPINKQTLISNHALTAAYQPPYSPTAHKSSGPDFGESGTQKAHKPATGFFMRIFRLCPRYGKAGGDTREGMPVSFCAGSPTLSVLPPSLAMIGKTPTTKGAPDHG